MMFTMPMGSILEIKCSKELDHEPDNDEQVEGVYYTIVWNGLEMPWIATTREHAYALALGAQWGAMQLWKKSEM